MLVTSSLAEIPRLVYQLVYWLYSRVFCALIALRFVAPLTTFRKKVECGNDAIAGSGNRALGRMAKVHGTIFGFVESRLGGRAGNSDRQKVQGPQQ